MLTGERASLALMSTMWSLDKAGSVGSFVKQWVSKNIPPMDPDSDESEEAQHLPDFMADFMVHQCGVLQELLMELERSRALREQLMRFTNLGCSAQENLSGRSSGRLSAHNEAVSSRMKLSVVAPEVEVGRVTPSTQQRHLFTTSLSFVDSLEIAQAEILGGHEDAMSAKEVYDRFAQLLGQSDSRLKDPHDIVQEWLTQVKCPKQAWEVKEEESGSCPSNFLFLFLSQHVLLVNAIEREATKVKYKNFRQQAM